jgi:hypothetical protein
VQPRTLKSAPPVLFLPATEVVVSGCSAGGLAVYLHVDGVAEVLQGSGAKVRGLAGQPNPTVTATASETETHRSMLVAHPPPHPLESICLDYLPRGDPSEEPWTRMEAWVYLCGRGVGTRTILNRV